MVSLVWNEDEAKKFYYVQGREMGAKKEHGTSIDAGHIYGWQYSTKS